MLLAALRLVLAPGQGAQCHSGEPGLLTGTADICWGSGGQLDTGVPDL